MFRSRMIDVLVGCAIGLVFLPIRRDRTNIQWRRI